MSTRTNVWLSSLRVAVLTILLLPLATPLAAGEEALTIRVNDAVSEPGGVVAVVLRTYASRPAGQGQVCLRGRRVADGGDQLFTDLEGFIVFSDQGDATADGFLDPLTGEILISFQSQTATINATDGVLLVAYMRLDPSVTAGERFELAMDLPDSFLFDENGDPIPLNPRNGELTIRAMGAPTLVVADGDKIEAGTPAELGVQTFEAFEVASGQVTLLYDPSLAGGTPVVSMDPRHGRAVFLADTSVPGRVSVTFTSDDASLNTVPGEIVSVVLPIAPGTPVGLYPLTLDSASTFLLDPGGVPVSVALGPGVIEILGPEAIFVDGFESGDLGAWSAVFP